jgi:SAM-dependent methyltransferase
MEDDTWRQLNRANWDERVAVHMGPAGYDLAPLRAGRGTLSAIEEAELPDVRDLRVLHLQCHIGSDTLALAQRGAAVVGLDFSAPAITAARNLAEELGLSGRARFVQADLYGAPAALAGEAPFDLVLVNWGAVCWLPDIAGWARVVAGFVHPGGRFYMAEGHPAALVMDSTTPANLGLPGYYVPYFHDGALVLDEATDYADPGAVLVNSRTHQFMHPVGSVVSALIAQGLRLDFLHEHSRIAWRMFGCLERRDDGMWHWPGERWLPLAYTLAATK